MPGLDEARLVVGAGEGSEQAVDAVARVAEHLLDAPLTQAMQEVVGDGRGHVSVLPVTARLHPGAAAREPPGSTPQFPVASVVLTSLERERRLPPRGLVLDLDLLHPLHPPEPTAAGGDEPDRSAMAGGQRDAADVRGEQQ